MDSDSIPFLLRPGTAIIHGKVGKSIEYDWSEQYTVLVNPAKDMDEIIEIPDSEDGKVGKMKLKLRVVASKEKVTVTVERGKAAKGWNVEVVGRKVMRVWVYGAESTATIENANRTIVRNAGAGKIELAWE
jgi:alpha-glucosidase (family GH31 glycosyl hydrolase)